MTLQVIIEDEDHHTPPFVKEVFRLEPKSEDLRPETLGLKRDEAKDVLAAMQTALVTAQATRFLGQQSFCPDCGMHYPKNGTHRLTFRTLFGSIKRRASASPPARVPRPKRGDRGKSRSVLALWRTFCWSEQHQSLSLFRPSGQP